MPAGGGYSQVFHREQLRDFSTDRSLRWSRPVSGSRPSERGSVNHSLFRAMGRGREIRECPATRPKTKLLYSR